MVSVMSISSTNYAFMVGAEFGGLFSSFAVSDWGKEESGSM